MKSITAFIKESHNAVEPIKTTVKEFIKIQAEGDWDEDICEMWYDNGGFDTFDDYEEMYKFLNSNKNEEITVHSDETDSDWEISFKLKGKEICISFMEPFKK